MQSVSELASLLQHAIKALHQPKRRADSKIDRRLTPNEREKAFLKCERISLAEGVKWLRETYGLGTSANALSNWLKKRRNRNALFPFLPLPIDSDSGSAVRLDGSRRLPTKRFSELPEFTRQKAPKVRQALGVYFAALAQGETKAIANTKARAVWLDLFGETCSEKTIRRRAARIEAFGGPEYAGIEAYADCKSVPHCAKQELAPTA